MSERQLTTASHGHILTNVGCWSHDGQWLVYDTRSDAAGSQFDGRWIERVHVASGRIERLFEAQRGAHCGVVTCCPRTDRIVFIHGPEAPSIDWAYAPYHRRGVIMDLAANPHRTMGLDSHCYAPPFVAGALRGGSHVHTWDALGKRVAFTYEDHPLAIIDRGQYASAELNQRNIGISDPVRSVEGTSSHPRNQSGSHFTVLVTHTVDEPQPGSDQIDRAYEDAWLGNDGLQLAFLGDVMGQSRARFTELFHLQLPTELTEPGPLGPLAGTETTRPRPPRGVVQRRLTHTEDRSVPGIVGPRHWPRSLPDGSLIFCLMSDSEKQPQLWSVSPSSGRVSQLTRAAGGVASTFSVSRDGQWIAYIAEDCVQIVSPDGRTTRRLTTATPGQTAPRPESCVISPNGTQVAYVRHLNGWNQLFVCDI